MHLAFRVQSEEFLVVTRIKLRDVLHPFLFRIPNFGGARVVGMKNGGSKEEKVFFSRNIVRRYACTLFTKRFSLPPPAKQMRFSDSAAFSCIFKGVARANLPIFNSAERVRRICENSIEHNREMTRRSALKECRGGILLFSTFHFREDASGFVSRIAWGPRKFYEARYRFILSFEQADFVNDVLLAGTR
ncbi:hypothetical protein ALC62_05123 [Cyphomyrmex costatus]|uniref:Uncharacterized protein n=1 Tax=Cyphomyrmex costatus TaxID=456900 RepID=A0A195CV04_9HYME|nr:hypothetical protein ALC62_05123 [Cyphomyrmex costatus]